MVICSQVGFEAGGLRDGGHHQGFASVDLSVGEASAFLAAAPWSPGTRHGEPEMAIGLRPERLATIEGRYKVTVRDKRPVLANLFRERILSTCLRTGEVVPFVEDPEAAFHAIVLRRMTGSDKSFAELAGEAQDFLDILHDLSCAPTIFAEGRDDGDDRTMARIMAYVDTHWNNVRGYHEVGPYEDFATLVAESMGYTTALLHLAAWGGRARTDGAALADTEHLRETAAVLQAVAGEEGGDARFVGALGPCVPADDPRAVVAQRLAWASIVDPRSVGEDASSRLRSHMLHQAPEIEADTLMRMIFRTPKYVPTADHYREWRAERPEPPADEAPRPWPACTWLDQHAFRSRASHPGMRCEEVETAMLHVAAAAIASSPPDRMLPGPADVRGRFDADLAAFFDPDYDDATFLVRLPPGFFRTDEGGGRAGIDLPAIMAHFAEKPFTYVDCPPGSFELGDGVEVKAVFARSAQITWDGATEALGPGSRFILDAVVGRAGEGPEHLLSWHLGRREATEVDDPFGAGRDGAPSETPSDLLRSVSRARADVLREAEEVLGRALRLARYGNGGPCRRRLLRFEPDDIRRRSSEADPKRSLFDVVKL